jgi:hypothetical protein
VREQLAGFTDELLAAGVPRVAWIMQPVPLPTPSAPQDQQAERPRHEVLHQVINDVALARPQVRVVDLDAWLVDNSPLATDEAARPDHVHWTTDAATVIANEFLGQALLRAALT